ncbi:multicopper oxidase domain-containing protein [Falsihalocynthiibacter sp. BN13B15]|uniref:multicopper oxidase domain-containing protein n=1 Tax=Falsihalocynthiibacter sp. BN13B15 TaxID=3240871 RepID=UPI00350FAC43
MKRRTLLGGIAASTAVVGFPNLSISQEAPKRLVMPPLMDATTTRRVRLEAQKGRTLFKGSSRADTWGFNQPFLGPTLRMATGQTTVTEVTNSLNEPISVHWHGLLVPGSVDGGPHQPIAPQATWTPEISLTQPTATAWYHSHIHGATAKQVQMGLAGVLQISDGQDDARELPSTYGVDDLTLVIQDRRFTRNGQMDLSIGMAEQMTGFLGDTMLINGQIGATAVVPRGVVRLRLLNGSNARIYTLALSDNRPMHLVATDSGLLDQPIALTSLRIAPGERYEVLVDFSNERTVTLVSAQNPNTGMMGGGNQSTADFPVLPFSVDASLLTRITRLPTALGGSRPTADAANAKWRRFSLDMSMGMGMMFRQSDRRFSINGAPFDMKRIDFNVDLGAMERWTISADLMMHPFHVHGAMFQVLSENGQPPQIQNTGWKDTVLVNGSVDLLIKFDHPASKQAPFMYHCHILEHEDGGMMGQFTVG